MSPYDDQMDEGTIPDETAAGADEYNQEGGGISARRVSADPVPGFKFYVLAPRGATLAFEFDEKTRPVGRHRFEVIEGPQGTVGLTLFADQRLYAQRERWTNQKDANGRAIMEPLSAEELGSSFLKFDETMGRIQAAFGLTARMPKNKTAVALGAYLAQFDPDAKPAPSNVVAEVKRQTKNGFTKNVIWFDSVAALDDPAMDGKFKTALAEAQAKIKAENDRLAKASAKTGGNRATAGRQTTPAAQAPALD